MKAIKAEEIFIQCVKRAYRVDFDDNTYAIIRQHSRGEIRTNNYWVDSNGNVNGGNYPKFYDSMEQFIDNSDYADIVAPICNMPRSKKFIEKLENRMIELLDMVGTKFFGVFEEVEADQIWHSLYNEWPEGLW